MKQFFVGIGILLLPNIIWGQYHETIRTGRPGMAIGAYTVGKNVFQLQTGIAYNHIENGPVETRSYINNSVIRLGILEKFELSGLINLKSDNISDGAEEQHLRGISDLHFGGRLNILERKGAIPAVGIQGRIILNAQGKDFERNRTGSAFILTTGNKITDWLSIGTNWGIRWSGKDEGPDSFYAINGSVGLTEKLGGFAEVYGRLDQFSMNYDAGFSFLVTNDLQLDISAGWQGDSRVSDWFIDMGLSWRLDWRK